MRCRAALAALLFLLLAPSTLMAADSRDQGDARPLALGSSPRRLPDGSVFLPKPAQHQIGVRTLPVETESLSRAVELTGKVVMDPNAGGKVQAIVSGRVTPGPRGFPLPGQTVSKGEVLAYVTPEVGGKNRSLAESRLLRLRELSDTVPRKVIEEAEAAVANEQLVAPVSGVVASASVVSGQVVAARDTLFEIVNPTRMLVEALAFDLSVANDVGAAFIAVGDQKISLRLIGVARSLRDQALPMTFRGDAGGLAGLAVGQPVKVFVQTRSRVSGIRIPTEALMKSSANQSIVWVKTAPEMFEPRLVTTEALDGISLVVTSGLKPGDRIAVRAATLINQIR